MYTIYLKAYTQTKWPLHIKLYMWYNPVFFGVPEVYMYFQLKENALFKGYLTIPRQ